MLFSHLSAGIACALFVTSSLAAPAHSDDSSNWKQNVQEEDRAVPDPQSTNSVNSILPRAAQRLHHYRRQPTGSLDRIDTIDASDYPETLGEEGHRRVPADPPTKSSARARRSASKRSSTQPGADDNEVYWMAENPGGVLRHRQEESAPAGEDDGDGDGDDDDGAPDVKDEKAMLVDAAAANKSASTTSPAASLTSAVSATSPAASATSPAISSPSGEAATNSTGPPHRQLTSEWCSFTPCNRRYGGGMDECALINCGTCIYVDFKSSIGFCSG